MAVLVLSLHMDDNRSNVLEIIRLGIAKENDVSSVV
jgi:hypothetical protein